MQHWVQDRGWRVQVLCDPASTPALALQAFDAVGAEVVRQADTAHFDLAVLQGTGEMARLEALLSHLPCLLWQHSGQALVINEPSTPRQWWRWFNAAAAIVMPSVWLRDVVYRSFLSEPALARCHVLPNPVWPESTVTPPALFAPRRPGCLRVLWAGVLNDLKRPQDLLDAALMMTQPIDLVMAGPLHMSAGVDSVSLRSVLASADQGARPFGRHRLQLTGPLAHDQLRALMREADLLVCTSTEETQGLVALEAALAGAALVLTDLPVYRREWGGPWSHLQNAWMVPVGQPAALAAALDALATDAALRQRLAEAARQAAGAYETAPFFAAMDSVAEPLFRAK